MVQYKILRVTDEGGAISIVVSIPSRNKIIPICMNPAAFKQMMPEEVEMNVNNIVEQMFGEELATATGVIQESKIVKVHKFLDLDNPDRPMRDSKRIPKDHPVYDFPLPPPLDAEVELKKRLGKEKEDKPK